MKKATKKIFKTFYLFSRHAQCPCRTNVCRCSTIITTTTNVRKYIQKEKKMQLIIYQRFIKKIRVELFLQRIKKIVKKGNRVEYGGG